MVDWNRSKDGYCESKCGRFHISPLYLGRCSPVEYELYYNSVKIKQWYPSQRSAKEGAEAMDRIIERAKK